MTDLVFEPDVVVTEQALARKQRFRENKDKQGLTDAVKSMSRKSMVYFNEQGDITCVTKDPDFDVDPSWFTYEFSHSEIAKLRNRSFSDFVVVKSQKQGKDHYEIKSAKSQTDRSVTHQTDFAEVSFTPVWDTEDTQVLVELSKHKITLKLTEKGEDFLSQYRKSDYQVKNQKFLSVFITVKKNPHYLIHDFKVPLKDLLLKDTIAQALDKDLTTYSVYVKPLFDYVRRV